MRIVNLRRARLLWSATSGVHLRWKDRGMGKIDVDGKEPPSSSIYCARAGTCAGEDWDRDPLIGQNSAGSALPTVSSYVKCGPEVVESCPDACAQSDISRGMATPGVL